MKVGRDHLIQELSSPNDGDIGAITVVFVACGKQAQARVAITELRAVAFARDFLAIPTQAVER